MKKIIGFLLGLISMCALSACDLSLIMNMGGSQSTESVASQEQTSEESLNEESESAENGENEGNPEEEGEHKHQLTRVAGRDATCIEAGNKTYWKCDCGTLFADAMGAKETTEDDVMIAKKEHILTHKTYVEPTCLSSGRMEHWICSSCKLTYTNEECTETILQSQTALGKADHDLTHYEEVAVVGRENGLKEHWFCSDCKGYFLDEACTEKTTQANTIVYSPWTIPDFVLEIEEGRDPVVLQLTDTQIIDSSQDKTGALGGSLPTMYAPSNMNIRCFDYLTEIITETNPDLIILTGDNIYGKFDHNGTVWTKLVDFMDSFDIPWAPIFGNHDNESNMGVDWQCEQLMKAENCLFKQRELSGNCNYSVAIAQGGEIKRVFYMLDSNGVGSPSQATKDNGHTPSGFVGLASDQIKWYTEQITKLQETLPDLKVSFAYHIQDTLFEKAYAKYGYVNTQPWAKINIDLHEDKAEGDFGYIGYVRGEWSQDINTLKALGVDSIFVGHEHSSSSSVVYEGIRFQFGQKSSEYDQFNQINSNGEIESKDYLKVGDTPLVGGSVIVLSEDDGSIADAYIYYCDDDTYGRVANGEIQWESFMETLAKAGRKQYMVWNKRYA